MTLAIPLPTTAPDAAARLPALLEMSLDEIKTWLAERGQPPMRAKQIRRWILQGRASDFEAMSDLPKGLREDLKASFNVFSTRIDKHLVAGDRTHKLLLRLHDDKLIECVLIQDEDRHTACISTQVGCGMGCVFCASGLEGVARNLSVGEMLEQLILLRNLTLTGERLTHIVVMGVGAPLANLDSLIHTLAIAGDKDGLGIV